jgi:hypothetical protein
MVKRGKSQIGKKSSKGKGRPSGTLKSRNTIEELEKEKIKQKVEIVR